MRTIVMCGLLFLAGHANASTSCPDGEAPIPENPDDLLEYQIRLEPPSIDVHAVQGSERELEERMRREAEIRKVPEVAPMPRERR